MMRYYIQLETVNGSAELQLVADDESARYPIPNSTVRDDEFALEDVPGLVVALREAEATPPRPVTRAEFDQTFQNQSLLPMLSVEQSPFRAFVRVGKAGLWARLALFKALYLFLASEGRHERLDADIVLAYCAWQRYSLVKAVWTPRQESESVRAIDYEFASAYRALTTLLEQERFAYAFHVLWSSARGPVLAYSLMRERLRLSLVLNRQEIAEGVKQTPEQPLPAPHCFQDAPQWYGIQLHARFQDAAGQAEVRRLVREWLLPRYALDEAVHLSWHLANKHGRSAWLLSGWSIVLLLLAVAVSFLLGWFVSADWSRLVATGGLLLLLPLALLITFCMLDQGTRLDLIMPRLCGGIVVGYLPLVLAEEAWRLVPLFGKLDCGTLGLWSVSLVVAWLYLRGGAFAFVNDRREAGRRAMRVLCWSLLLSIFFGIWFSQLAQPIYEHAGLSFNHLLYGFFNLRIPLEGVLTFVPMALLVGLIVQILWEEKPVTATVWPGE